MGTYFNYALGAAAAVNIVFQLIIQFPINHAALERARFVCREESAKLNLQLASDHVSSSVEINLIYEKWNSVRCGKGYEADSQNRQRNREVYLEVSTTGMGNVSGGMNDINRMYKSVPASTRVLGDTQISL